MPTAIDNESMQRARDLYDQGRYAESEQVCRAILRSEPDNPQALSILGYLAMQGGALPVALDCFQRLCSLQPEFAGHHGVLATALRLAGRHEEALKAQQTCAALAPDDPDALQNLASQYSEMGFFDLARDTYTQVLALNPRHGRAHYGLSLIKTFAHDDPQISQMQKLLQDQDPDQENSARIAFSLGKAHEDLQAYDQAFEYYALGNKTKRQLLKFDAGNEFKNALRIEHAFTSELRESLQVAGSDSSLPVFIVGMPRSGSTLVEQIIDAHPEVHGAGEINNLFKVFSHGLQNSLAAGDEYPEAISTIPAQVWRRMGENYVQSIRGLAPDASRIVDKQLFNYALVGAISLMLPNARIIHCVRDPLDTCISCFTQNFGAERGFSCDLTELGQTYRAYQRMMKHWQHWLPTPMLEVVYEEVVADPAAQARRLVEFLDLEWSDACLNFHQSKRAVVTSSQGQVRSPVHKKSVQRWRRFEKHLGPLKAALLADD